MGRRGEIDLLFWISRLDTRASVLNTNLYSNGQFICQIP